MAASGAPEAGLGWGTPVVDGDTDGVLHEVTCKVRAIPHP